MHRKVFYETIMPFIFIAHGKCYYRCAIMYYYLYIPDFLKKSFF